ncbi:endonuclease III homolog 1 [Monosporozyma servazzii]
MTTKRRIKKENARQDVDGETSKYFHKKVKLSQDIDTKWVQSLDNKGYFNWIIGQTGNVPKRWAIPLDPAIFDDNVSTLPTLFKPVYLKLRQLRAKIETPVDTVGGSTLPFTIGKKCGIERDQIIPINYRVQVLIGVMLSSQTKDEMTARAFYNLMKYCQEELGSTQGITVKSLQQIDEKTMDELINCVGFHTRKANYIKRTCDILAEKYACDIPTNDTDLLALPGVGPKMTYLTLQKAWGKMDGICVDVHVHRFCQLFHWVDAKKCKDPNSTRITLESWLPVQLWKEINVLLVGLGQLIDRPKKNRINICETLLKDDPEAIDLIEHMTNYKDWANYIVKLCREELNNTGIKLELEPITNSDVKVKTEDNTLGLPSTENDIHVKLEDPLVNISVKQENVSHIKQEQ